MDTKELQDFVRSTIEGIERGLKEDYVVAGDIEFEVAVVKIKEAGGGLRLHVIDVSGKHDRKEVSKIKFKIQKQNWPNDLEGVNFWDTK